MRTTAQLQFDAAIKGWAFSHRERLGRILKRAETLATHLAPEDERRRILITIRRHLQKESGEQS